MPISTYNRRVIIYIFMSVFTLVVVFIAKRENYINTSKLQMFFAICGPPFVYRVTSFLKHMQPRSEILDLKIESSKSIFFSLSLFYFLIILGSLVLGKFDTVFDISFLGILALNESILGTILSYYLVNHIARKKSITK